jgi:hypothetical protein
MAINTSQKRKGLFHGHLVLRVFGTHLTITENAENIPGLHIPAIENPAAVGGLGLACASVKLVV